MDRLAQALERSRTSRAAWSGWPAERGQRQHGGALGHQDGHGVQAPYPLRYVLTSGMPLPAARGSMKLHATFGGEDEAGGCKTGWAERLQSHDRPAGDRAHAHATPKQHAWRGRGLPAHLTSPPATRANMREMPTWVR